MQMATSNGTFKTTKVGNFELLLPEFSKSRLVTMKPDIVDMPADTSPPVYDLIIGVETMASLGCILDFQNNELLWIALRYQ